MYPLMWLSVRCVCMMMMNDLSPSAWFFIGSIARKEAALERRFSAHSSNPAPKPYLISHFTPKQASIGRTGSQMPAHAGTTWWWQWFRAFITI